eukprot:TRINITY_DN5211_c0_g1::TRINITY_DN5211_c0_g1_i1::g.23397::m.23397 TRINITY_DN5211_c0_g1::TRINITY_DN5211_c0_g1_i1::g.23397  ORF type:complete len:239 (-),score=8.07,sp/Q96LU5/IMP1L_HUMAN/36.62/1e-23,Peptidase_S24/PF00717.18/3.7e-10,Peptidase_S26/PF10502.4/0.81,Peptidase_S26/PF10502.4/0.013 TRINITY_DN5211_c0_g1_i1:28-687(-)
MSILIRRLPLRSVILSPSFTRTYKQPASKIKQKPVVRNALLTPPTMETSIQASSNTMFAEIWDAALTFAVGYCAFSQLAEYFVGFCSCSGQSMYPTLRNNSLLLYTPLRKNYDSVRRGDVLLIKNPTKDGHIVKRVAGLPGDTVCYVDREGQKQAVVVPPGHMFVRGDNPRESRDSRTYGPIPLGLVKAKVHFQMALTTAGMVRPNPLYYWEDEACALD